MWSIRLAANNTPVEIREEDLLFPPTNQFVTNARKRLIREVPRIWSLFQDDGCDFLLGVLIIPGPKRGTVMLNLKSEHEMTEKQITRLDDIQKW